jgi:hypothetical protein
MICVFDSAGKLERTIAFNERIVIRVGY